MWLVFVAMEITPFRGFGFVRFVDPKSVDQVQNSVTHVIDGKKVHWFFLDESKIVALMIAIHWSSFFKITLITLSQNWKLDHVLR